ncbi:hypothetical protein ACJX0J_008686, partial [Zea mays]
MLGMIMYTLMLAILVGRLVAHVNCQPHQLLFSSTRYRLYALWSKDTAFYRFKRHNDRYRLNESLSILMGESLGGLLGFSCREDRVAVTTQVTIYILLLIFVLLIHNLQSIINPYN